MIIAHCPTFLAGSCHFSLVAAVQPQLSGRPESRRRKLSKCLGCDRLPGSDLLLPGKGGNTATSTRKASQDQQQLIQDEL